MARVLIVDDDVHMRLLVRLTIEMDASLVVVGEAADGREAIALVEKLTPDLIVMDLTMPVMDGIEATRRIMQSSPATQVIAFSSVINQSEIDAVMAAGAFAKVDKTEPDRLLAVLQELASKPSVALAETPPWAGLAAARKVRVALRTAGATFVHVMRSRANRVATPRSAGGLVLAGASFVAIGLLITGIQSNESSRITGRQRNPVAAAEDGFPRITWPGGERDSPKAPPVNSEDNESGSAPASAIVAVVGAQLDSPPVAEPPRLEPALEPASPPGRRSFSLASASPTTGTMTTVALDARTGNAHGILQARMHAKHLESLPPRAAIHVLKSIQPGSHAKRTRHRFSKRVAMANDRSRPPSRDPRTKGHRHG